MTNKIKFSAPLLLAGLLLASCNKDGIGNRLYLDIEQPGSNGSKVLLSGTRTMWMDDDEIKVITGAGSEDSYVKKVKYSSDRTEVYLDGDEIPQPAEGYYYLACYPKDAISPHTGNTLTSALDDGQDYKTIKVNYSINQYWAGGFSRLSRRVEYGQLKDNVPMAAMTHRDARRLYMRPLSTVIDVRLTNNFSNNIGLKITNVSITSNMPIAGNRTIHLYPGANAQRPTYEETITWSDYFNNSRKTVSLNVSWINPYSSTNPEHNFENHFIPGTTFSFPVSIAPTDCIDPNAQLSSTMPTNTTLTITVTGETSEGIPFTITRTANCPEHIAGGLYFSAPIEVDENTISTTTATEIDLRPGNGGSGLSSGERFDDGGSI